jgi:ethanolamine utilization protein EutN
VILGRVSGSLYSTINHKYYDGKRILLVDLITPDGKTTGDYLFAIDTVGAGAGENVLIIDEGNSARQILDSEDGPVRSVIVGVVDEVEIG